MRKCKIITKNEHLNNLLDGKRIVIVGPSPHLVNKNMGSIIDEYDIVCRVNDIIPFSELRKDYGKRTDILFHNCSTDGMPGLVEKIEHDRSYWENLKLVVCPSIKARGPQNDYLSWQDDYISDVVKNFESVNYSNIPFYWIGVKDYKTLWSVIGIEPNCGMLSIMLMLGYPIKELLVMGFSFYTQGTKKCDVYCKGHFPDSVPTSDGMNFAGGHAQERQKEVFKELYNNDRRIKIDFYMNDILDLEQK